MILTVKDVPDCLDVPTIGTIPGNHLFPIHSVTRTPIPFFIHKNGSVFQLFELTDFKVSAVQSLLETLEFSSSFQLYTLKKGSQKRHYLCLSKDIDASFLDVPFTDAFRLFFAGVDHIKVRLERQTRAAYAHLVSALPENAKPASLTKNELLAFLVDYRLSPSGLPLPTSPVKSNLGALLTGENRYSLVSSLNNIDLIPNSAGALSGIDYLLTVSCTRPSKEQNAKILGTAGKNSSLLQALAPKDLESRISRVDTIEIEQDQLDFLDSRGTRYGGVYFIDASFLLCSDKGMSDLSLQYSVFQKLLSTQGILHFTHSTSARAQYTSLFPGNALYGEHFNTAYRPFIFTLCRKLLSL